MKKLASLSVVFPAYNDEHTIPILVKKILTLLPNIAKSYEIVIVNDGSSDDTANVLKKLQKKIRKVRVITHMKNQGYGAALITGFKNASKDFIFYTDSDGQYDILELTKLVNAMDMDVDVITGFKLRRADSWFRKLIGRVYNQSVKALLDLKVRDVDCDFRLFRKKLLDDIKLEIRSGAFDAAFIKLLQEKGVRFKEIGVYHYPRFYGNSQFFNVKKIGESLWDLISVWFTYAK